MAVYLSMDAGTRLKASPGSSDIIADGQRPTNACSARDVECSVTSPHPDCNAAVVASTAAPGIVWHPATISRCP